MSQRRGRLLFVNKKKQKNFFPLGPCCFSASGPKSKTFFAPLFFKKAAASLFPLKPITTPDVDYRFGTCQIILQQMIWHVPLHGK